MAASAARRLGAVVILLLLAACAGGEPREPTKVVDEIREGPGVFSGEDGEFVLYRR